MKHNNDFPEKEHKNTRGEKPKNKRNKNRYEFDDFSPRDIKQDLKKKRENFQDEEWEDWDRYYNH